MLLPACSGTTLADPMIGQPASDVRIKTLDGSVFSLADARNKTILINFWSTTCPPCVEELPIFQRLQDNLSTRSDVDLLMIDLNDDLATLQNFVQSKKYTFRVLIDSSFASAQSFNVRYTPTTILIDRQGIVRVYKVGAFTNLAELQMLTSAYFR